MVCGPFSMVYVPSVLVVRGDASATASRVLASESIFRLGILSDTAIFLSEVALTAVLYENLRPAGRLLARTATFARLAMSIVQAVNLLLVLATFRLLQGDRGLSVFETAQVHSLAFVRRDVHGLGVHVWETFFGFHCFFVGVIVFRSGYFPRPLGVLMGIASAGYSIDGLGHLLVPRYAPAFDVIVAVAAVVGEVPFVLWLVFRGVDEKRWEARARS